MSRSEEEQTGEQYFAKWGANWQRESETKDELVVIQTVAGTHMKVIAAGLAAETGKNVRGIDPIAGQEWLVKKDEAATLLKKPLSEILKEIMESGGSEPRLA